MQIIVSGQQLEVTSSQKLCGEENWSIDKYLLRRLPGGKWSGSSRHKAPDKRNEARVYRRIYTEERDHRSRGA